MQYIGQFSDIQDNIHFLTFEVVGDSASTSIDIDLADNPFTTDMDASSDNLYKPVKCQNAVARILTKGLDDYMFNLYSSGAKDVKVTLRQGDNIEWVGYVEPSLYDIGYVYEREVLEVNCIDGLSILQFLKYEPIGEEKGIYSLKNIIAHIAKQCECYSHLYLAQNLFISEQEADAQTNIFDRVNISEQIFFNRDGKEESDDTFKQALEKILTYLGMTIVAQGDDIYVIDLDAVKNNITSYVKVDLNGIEPDTIVNMPSQNTITAGQYASDNSRLSLDKVYQRASVEDNFYAADNLLPDIFDETHQVRIFPDNTSDGLPKQAIVQCHIEDENDSEVWCFYRVYRNDLYNFYAYDDNNDPVDLDTYILRRSFLDTYKDLDDSPYYEARMRNKIERDYPTLLPPDLMRTWGQCCVLCDYYNYDGEVYPYKKLLDESIIMPYFSMTKNLVLCVNEPDGSNPKSTRKLFELKPTYKSPITLGGDEMFLVIEGSAIYQDTYGKFGYSPETKKNDKWTDENAYITCQLRYGNKCWNGSAWVDNEVMFPLYLWGENHSHYIGQELKVKNNISWRKQINANGTAIPFPEPILDTDAFTFTMYTPRRINQNYLVTSVWLKDFKISVHVVGEEGDESTDTSKTLYYNEDNSIFSDINRNNVEEFPTVEFHLTTYDGKKAAYSCPSYLKSTAEGNKYLKEVYNRATGDFLIPEQMLIKRIVDQYGYPARMLTLDLNVSLPLITLVHDDVVGADFIIDTVSHDFKYNTHNYQLIEKR